MTTYKTLLKEVRTLKRIANDEFKEKLLTLLKSGDIDQINQALSLNESLGILSNQEIGDVLFSQVMWQGRIVKEQWKQGGLGWELLKILPSHPTWKNLKELWVLDNNLTSIPKEIENLTNLEELGLSSNKLTSLPKEIGNLKNLTHLVLARNKLTSVPSWIGNLKNLEYLDLGSNNLTSVPSWIGNLTKLEYLGLGGNNLTSLPKEIENLKNLNRLDLYINNLTSVPSWIGNLTNLKWLDIRGNDLTLEDIPPNLQPITEI